VRFWGTRGSIPVPGRGTLRYGGNTSCVEVGSSDGARVLLDAGSGAHAFAREVGPDVTRPGHLLLSHLHWDHVQGLPFCDPLFARDAPWRIYLPTSPAGGLGHAFGAVERQMGYANHPIAFDEMPGQPELHVLREGHLDLEGIRVHTRWLHHPTLTLGFRLEADGAAVVYCSDHEPHEAHPEDRGLDFLHREDHAHLDFVRGADLLIHDAQYRHEEYARRIGWGHTSVERAVDYAVTAGVGCLALFHHDPTRGDTALEEIVEKAALQARAAGSSLRVIAAAEGVAMDLEGKRAPSPAAESSALDHAPGRPAVMAAGRGGLAERLLHPPAASTTGSLLLLREGSQELTRFVEGRRPDVVVLERLTEGPDPMAEAARLREALPADRRPALLLWTAEVPSSATLKEAFDAGFDDVAGGVAKRSVLRSRLETWAIRRRSS
jgi:phosphoribosyl 1,2-cyclic phosphodiesterase